MGYPFLLFQKVGAGDTARRTAARRRRVKISR
jgi:hypothetical protein